MRSLALPAVNRQTVVRVLGTLVTVVLLVVLLREQGWDAIVAALSQIPLWRLLLALVLMIISRITVSIRWYSLLHSAGIEISPGKAIRINFAGLFANNFLPATIGGDVIRLAATVQLKLDIAICTASLIVDRLAGMAGMAVMVPFGLPSFFQSPSPATLLQHPQLLFSGMASLPFGSWWKNAWGKGLRVTRRLFVAMAIWIRQPVSLIVALVFTWINMLCLFLFLKIMLDGMGQNIPLLLTGGLYSIVYLVTLVPFSINGYGLQEISMTYVFSHYGGTTVASALVVALLFRTFMMIASLPGALFLPEIMQSTRRRTP